MEACVLMNPILVIYVSHMRMTDGFNKAITYFITYLCLFVIEMIPNLLLLLRSINFGRILANCS